MLDWDWFQAEAAKLDVPVSDAQRDAFRHFHALLVAANETTNLTRIVDTRDAIVKHYLDSLLFLRQVPADWHDRPICFMDVGTGPGIPGIPLLIMRPHWTGALLDSVNKKVAFMTEVALALGLSGARPTHGRAEDLGHEPAFRETFDLGLARAVAAMPELLELCLPFVKPGGLLVLSKGSKGPDEMASAGVALDRLNGRLDREERVVLPQEAGERHLYVISKQGKLAKNYPRKPGIPHRKPLG